MLRLDINIGSTSFANLFNVIDYHTMFSFLIRLINLLFKTREKRNKKKIASNKLIMSDLKPIRKCTKCTFITEPSYRAPNTPIIAW